MKTAWFCGTFDPIHIGHLHVASFVKEEFFLDRVIFLPAGLPPNKSESAVSPGNIRIDLIKTVVKNKPWLDVSDIEVRRDGPSYMIDTVREIRNLSPDEPVTLMMGQDNLESFNSWKNWEELLSQINLIVFRKSCHPALLPNFLMPFSDRIHFSSAPVIEISSTDIRNRIRLGKPVDYVLPESVKDAIFGMNLYQMPS